MDYLPITTSYIVKKKLVIALLDARTIQNIIGVCNRLVLFCFINRRPKVFQSIIAAIVRIPNLDNLSVTVNKNYPE